MRAFDAKRYVMAETAISVAANVVVTVVPASLSTGSEAAAPVMSAQRLAFDALPQLFMIAFMSALVPALLTRRRHLKGRLGVQLDHGRTSVARIVLTAVLLAAAPAGLGTVLVGIILPQLLGDGLTTGDMLLFKGAYGGLVAALVTPVALFLLFESHQEGEAWAR